MTFNYRIFREKSFFKDKFVEDYYTIRTVYYDDEGNPTSYSETFSHPLGLNLDELRIDLCRMMEAISKPILIIRNNKIFIDPAGK